MKSVIFGVYSQDAAFLSDILKSAGHQVIGVRNIERVRRDSIRSLAAVDEVIDVEFSNIASLQEIFRIAEVGCAFNLVGFSSVYDSFLDPLSCNEVNFNFFHRLLEAARLIQSRAHIVQCSSSEMFGGTTESFVHEASELSPISPYGVSKAASHLLATVYRNSYFMNVSSSILFNHESEFRPAKFFTKRAALGLVDVYLGKAESIQLEKVDFERDWSFAGDVAKALSLIALSPTPGDFVVSSGSLRSGRDFLEIGLAYLGMQMRVDDIVVFKSNEVRPLDHHGFAGDSSKIRKSLGWSPEVGFEGLVKRMIDFELSLRQ